MINKDIQNDSIKEEKSSPQSSKGFYGKSLIKEKLQKYAMEQDNESDYNDNKRKIIRNNKKFPTVNNSTFIGKNLFFLPHSDSKEISSLKRVRRSLLINNKKMESSKIVRKTALIPYTTLKKKLNFDYKLGELPTLVERKESTKNYKNEKDWLLTPKQFQIMIKNSSRNSDVGRLSRRLKFVDVLLAVIVGMNLFLALIENEIYYEETEKYLEYLVTLAKNDTIDRELYRKLESREITSKENTIRYINCIFVGLLLILNFCHYFFKLKKKKKEGILLESEGLVSSGLYKYCICEILILCWLNPPYINYFLTGITEGYVYAFSLGSLICVITISKCYVIIRVYMYFSQWTTGTAIALCNNAGANPGVHFSLKAELKNRPFTMLIFVFFCVVISFGFALRTFEYFAVPVGTPFYSMKGHGNDQDHLKDYINSIWNIIVTMTTVGYGDLVPKENFGRIINFVVCIFGLLLVSLIIVSLAILSEFTEEEKRAYIIIKKLKANENTIRKCVDVLNTVCLQRLLLKNRNLSLGDKFSFISKLKQTISLLKDDYKIATSMPLPLDQTLKLVNEGIKENYDVITENILKLKQIKEFTTKISESQKNCIQIMKAVKKRQEKLGKYLIKLNNEKLIKSLRKNS